MGELELKKNDGQSNLADALTKHVDGDGTTRHMQGTGQYYAQGRHAVMPAVAEIQ